MVNFIGTGNRLKPGDVGRAAHSIGIPTAALLAFLEVEAAGRGFDNQKRVKILPEAHIFWRYLPKNMRDRAKRAGLAYPKWKPGSYNFDKYKRFGQMIVFNQAAAYKSVSYGLGQIMGFNHVDAGHVSAKQMFEFAQKGEAEQLQQLVTLMKSWGIDAMIIDRDLTNPDSWRSAVRKYNGAGYAKNNYHVKIAKAYLKHVGQTPSIVKTFSSVLKLGSKGESVRNYQSDLQSIGYVFEYGVDGRFGEETVTLTKLFQERAGLTVDGFAGEKTLNALQKAVEMQGDKDAAETLEVKQFYWFDFIIQMILGFKNAK